MVSQVPMSQSGISFVAAAVVAGTEEGCVGWGRLGSVVPEGETVVGALGAVPLPVGVFAAFWHPLRIPSSKQI